MINYLFILDRQFIIEIISVANIVLYKSYYSSYIFFTVTVFLQLCLLVFSLIWWSKWKISFPWNFPLTTQPFPNHQISGSIFKFPKERSIFLKDPQIVLGFCLRHPSDLKSKLSLAVLIALVFEQNNIIKLLLLSRILILFKYLKILFGNSIVSSAKGSAQNFPNTYWDKFKSNTRMLDITF